MPELIDNAGRARLCRLYREYEDGTILGGLVVRNTKETRGYLADGPQTLAVRLRLEPASEEPTEEVLQAKRDRMAKARAVRLAKIAERQTKDV